MKCHICIGRSITAFEVTAYLPGHLFLTSSGFPFLMPQVSDPSECCVAGSADGLCRPPSATAARGPRVPGRSSCHQILLKSPLSPPAFSPELMAIAQASVSRLHMVCAARLRPHMGFARAAGSHNYTALQCFCTILCMTLKHACRLSCADASLQLAFNKRELFKLSRAAQAVEHLMPICCQEAEHAACNSV